MAKPGDADRPIEPETTPPLARHEIVLWGAGHTNTHIIRMWAMNKVPDARLTCISNFPIATYSGMLPAFLSGQCDRGDIEIDLVQLCKIAGVRLIVDQPTCLSHERQLIHFHQRPPLRYDALSLGIGSIPDIPPEFLHHPSTIAIKPMQTFPTRLLERAILATTSSLKNEKPIRVAIIGAGAAGVEIALSLPRFFARQQALDHCRFSFHLTTRSSEILPGELPKTRLHALRSLGDAGVLVQCNHKPTASQLDGFDLAVWATGAKAPEILTQLNLPTDERGFLLTSPTLQSLGSEHVFAVGDSGSLSSKPTPKAGVYAVRQGPVLWENLRRFVSAQPLLDFKPQRQFLKLLNTADGAAIAQNWSLSLHGKLWRKLKDYIDGKFMAKFRLTPMEPNAGGVMQCSGCGCKLPAAALQIGLGPQSQAAVARATVGQAKPAIEDAVEIAGSNGKLIASTDFFSLPTDDAWLAGRIAAIHSASDILVSGGKPTQLLANVVIPAGDPTAQTHWLSDFQAGAQLEADRMGAVIAGGHTIVGPRAEAGFTVIGTLTGSHLRKGQLRAGQNLYLTKPLGIGVALAAYGAGRCTAQAWMSAVDAMLQTDHAFPEIAKSLGITAATDVTGFGLAGHLIEMLTTSRLSAELSASQIPVLGGIEELLASGIRSSLWQANVRSFASQMESPSSLESFAILFDPQTCGGVLFASDHPAEKIDSTFADHDSPPPTRIGRVQPLAEPLLIVRV